MVYYHQVITQEKSEEFDFVEIEIYSDRVFIKESKYILEISMETAILLAEIIEKGQ